jgi:hypothetical protein
MAGISTRATSATGTPSTESTESGELSGGRALGAGRVDLRADRAGHRPGGRGALVAPQRVAEAGQGDAGGDGEEPEVDLRHQGDRQGCDGANGKERGGPPGQDVGAEECDAEDEASGEVGEAGWASSWHSARCRVRLDPSSDRTASVR